MTTTAAAFLRYQNTSLFDFHKTLSFDLLIQFLNGQFNIGNKLEKVNVTEIKKRIIKELWKSKYLGF